MSKFACFDCKKAFLRIEDESKFATFAEKAQSVKAAVVRSLERLETLKKALMQKFFFEEAQG